MKILIYVITIFSLFGLSVSAEENTSPLIINEFMADPDGTDSKYEWIELYNNSENDIQLGEWKLDGVQLTNKLIPPDSYVLIVRSVNDFIERYGVHDLIVQHSFSLSNTTDTILLTNSQFNDRVEYTTSVTEKSLERSCSENTFTLNELGNSVGRINNSCLDLTIEFFRDDEWSNNTSGFLDEIVKVKTKTSFDQYHWSVGEYTSTGAVLDLTLSQLNEIIVDLSAVTGNNSINISIAIDVFPRIRFNEIYANPVGSDSGKEWIEFRNNSNIELQEWVLKDLTSKEIFDISNEEFFVFYTKKITLNNSGEFLQLLAPSGLISDELELPKINEDISYSLINGKWSMEFTKSPGESNETAKLIIKEEKTPKSKTNKSTNSSKPSQKTPKPKIDYPENIVLVNQESTDEEIDVEENSEVIIGNLLLITSGLGTLIRRYLHF